MKTMNNDVTQQIAATAKKDLKGFAQKSEIVEKSGQYRNAVASGERIGSTSHQPI